MTLRYLAEDDGLSKTSAAETVYVNPPYSGGSAFIRKAFESWRKNHCRVVLMLLPVQTHTITFHECVIGHADVFLLRGRIAFVGPSGSKKEAPFPNMIVIYGADPPMITRMLSTFDCVHLPRSAAVGRAGWKAVKEAAE